MERMFRQRRDRPRLVGPFPEPLAEHGLQGRRGQEPDDQRSVAADKRGNQQAHKRQPS